MFTIFIITDKKAACNAVALQWLFNCVHQVGPNSNDQDPNNIYVLSRNVLSPFPSSEEILNFNVVVNIPEESPPVSRSAQSEQRCSSSASRSSEKEIKQKRERSETRSGQSEQRCSLSVSKSSEKKIKQKSRKK